jgi:hypothetical protein
VHALARHENSRVSISDVAKYIDHLHDHHYSTDKNMQGKPGMIGITWPMFRV